MAKKINVQNAWNIALEKEGIIRTTLVKTPMEFMLVEYVNFHIGVH